MGAKKRNKCYKSLQNKVNNLMHGTWEYLGEKYRGPHFLIFRSTDTNTTVAHINMTLTNEH